LVASGGQHSGVPHFKWTHYSPLFRRNLVSRVEYHLAGRVYFRRLITTTRSDLNSIIAFTCREEGAKFEMLGNSTRSSPRGWIAPAVEVHQDAGRVACRDNRPFPRYPARIDSSQGDVLGHWPNRAYLVEALTAFCPSGRPRFRGQQLTDRCNLGLVPAHFRQPRSDHLARHFYELPFSVLASRDWSAC